MLETRFGQVTEEGERRLPDFRHRVLHAQVQQLHDVAVFYQLLDVAVQSFREAGQEIKGDDHEVFVGSLESVRVLRICLCGMLRGSIIYHIVIKTWRNQIFSF